ncbi:MAG TPA: hypothetical protein VHZ95_08665 [Polyangiales bacterium]|jgi:hypothetical protein|nr:hypothetical protein [Polyangiales bacterium]
MRWRIEQDFRGNVLPIAHQSEFVFARRDDELIVDIDAPYFGDPPPSAATDRLWDCEVAELFIADHFEHYLEIELSPHGQHLVLELQGVRRIVRSRLPIDYAVQIIERTDPAHPELKGRYRGRARMPFVYLPRDPVRGNAYSIHGIGSARCYCAHNPPRGDAPDFHRLESFVPLSLEEKSAQTD